jgi:nicotinamidase-related amidase
MVLGVLVVDVQPFFFSNTFRGKEKKADQFIAAWNRVLDELSHEYRLIVEMPTRAPTLPSIGGVRARGVELPRFQKTTIDAFLLPGDFSKGDSKTRGRLVDELREQRVDALVIGGLYGDVCVISTIVGAKKAGFPVYTAYDLVDVIPHAVRSEYASSSNVSRNVDSLLRKIEPYRLPR